MPLERGDKAPDLALLDGHGQPSSLSTSLEQRKAPQLVHFYPVSGT